MQDEDRARLCFSGYPPLIQASSSVRRRLAKEDQMVIAWVLMWIVIGYASLLAMQPSKRPARIRAQARSARAR